MCLSVYLLKDKYLQAHWPSFVHFLVPKIEEMLLESPFLQVEIFEHVDGL